MRKYRDPIPTPPRKFQPFHPAIAPMRSSPNPLAQFKGRSAAPENREAICDPLPRFGALFHEADLNVGMLRRPEVRPDKPTSRYKDHSDAASSTRDQDAPESIRSVGR